MRRLLILDKSMFKIAMALISIRILVDLIYENYVYRFPGFVINSDFFLSSYSWILYGGSIFVFFIIGKRQDEKASVIVFQFLYLLSFLPFTTCIKYGVFPRDFIIYGSLFWCTMFVFMYINTYVKVLPVRVSEKRRNIMEFIPVVIIGAACVVLLAMSYYYTGFRLHFGLYDVYKLRTEASHYSIPMFLKYIYGWTTVIISLAIVYAYLKKKKLFLLFLMLCVLLRFGFDGSKTALMTPLLFLCVSFLHEHIHRMDIQKLLVYGMLLLSLFALLNWMVFHNEMLATLFIRREMLLENLNSFYYYDFFQAHNCEYDYFRAGFLRHLGFETPYAKLANTIGQVYYGRETVVNCGLIAEALTNFGSAGMIGYPCMIILFMRIYDKVMHRLPKCLVICAGFYLAHNLVNTFFMVSLLTHGILVFMLLCFCMSMTNVDHPK